MVTGMPARSVQRALAEFSFDIRAGCSSRQRSNHSRQGRHLAIENIGPFSRIAECHYLAGAARSISYQGTISACFRSTFAKNFRISSSRRSGCSRAGKCLGHFSFLYYVVCLSSPAKRRDSYLPRKIRVRHGSLQAWRRRHFLFGEPVLAIDSHGGAHRVCNPVESDVGQKCVAVHSRKKIAVVVRKQLKFAYHSRPTTQPESQSGRRQESAAQRPGGKKLLSGRLKYAYRFRSASLICATASGFGGSAVMRFR
jgi:hypothetical protein